MDGSEGRASSRPGTAVSRMLAASRQQILARMVLLAVVCAAGAMTGGAQGSAAPPALQRLVTRDEKEKFLWYAPHSGFGNQLVAFRHALRVAGLLNRTLIVPPVLRHFDVWLGRCELGTARHPDLIRRHTWRAISRLMQSQNYISMGDVVDVSRLSPDLVRTIDLRLFMAMECGVDVSPTLKYCTWCGALQDELRKVPLPDLPESFTGTPLDRCGQLLGFVGRARRLPGYRRPLVAQVRRSCSDTIWTYGRDERGALVSRFRPSVPQGTCPGYRPGLPPHFEHDYIREGLKVSRAANLPLPEPVNVVMQLAPRDTVPGETKVLTLGSTMHYFDLEAPLGEARADRISCETAFLPFTGPIMRRAQAFSRSPAHLGRHFVCLHYRGGDGVFDNVEARNRTTHGILDKLVKLQDKVDPERNLNATLFIMSDLRTYKWRRRLKRIFGSPGYEVHFPIELEEFKHKAEKDVLSKRYGVFTNRISQEDADEIMSIKRGTRDGLPGRYSNWASELTDMGIYLEQAVCSCAVSGFIGHPESTISENIYHLRAGGMCSLRYDF